MKLGNDGKGGRPDVLNPFGVMDVPEPNDRGVEEFAAQVIAQAILDGAADDDNAKTWATAAHLDDQGIEGPWTSRWNGGADPTIPGDAANKWKQGAAELKIADGRVYLRFDWDNGARKGLIDACRDGAARLVGKYINLTNPSVIRPWVGLIVNNRRIDGRWTLGRLDFRR